MKGSSWHIAADGPGASPPASTVSLAFVLSSVRRLWYLWLAFTLVGVFAATGWLLVVPERSVGTVTLLLAHDPGTDPETAMATDISLLRTRIVAQDLSDRLSLDEPVQDLQESILAQPTTSSVLQVDITGADVDDAVSRARALAEIYLAFREEQLLRQNDAIIDGHRQRIAALQSQVDELTEQYDAITERGGDGSEEQAAAILTSKSQALDQIAAQENAIEDASLGVSAIVAASRVLDPASLVPQTPLRRAVLVLGSGLVGGLGLGLGLVVIYSVTTGRLRTRADVAAAMGLPVTFSTGRVSRRWRAPSPRQEAGLDLLVDGFLTALPATGKRPHRLALVSVDCHREAAMVVARAADRLGEHKSVVAVDLTGTGVLAQQVGSTPARREPEPDRNVTVVDTATDAVADVMLVLIPFDVGRGLAHVKASARRCAVMVKVGQSTPEGLRTVAQASRAAGVDFAFVMLVGADSSDDSFGAPPDTVEVAEKTPRAR